jgi:branched-chain amino acid transport system permease protein
MVLIGGVQGLAGPMLGAAVLVTLTALITQYTSLWGLVLGILIIAFTLFLRVGIFDFFAARWARPRRRPGAPSGGPAAPAGERSTKSEPG